MFEKVIEIDADVFGTLKIEVMSEKKRWWDKVVPRNVKLKFSLMIGNETFKDLGVKIVAAGDTVSVDDARIRTKFNHQLKY